MSFEEIFKGWTLDQKVEWALGPNICNLSNQMRSIIVDLKAENEQLKRELKQMEVQDQVVVDTQRSENEKLKCLALHLFSNYFFLCYWQSEGLDPNKYLRLHEKYNEAYRKAKKTLKEGKRCVRIASRLGTRL